MYSLRKLHFLKVFVSFFHKHPHWTRTINITVLHLCILPIWKIFRCKNHSWGCRLSGYRNFSWILSDRPAWDSACHVSWHMFVVICVFFSFCITDWPVNSVPWSTFSTNENILLGSAFQTSWRICWTLHNFLLISNCELSSFSSLCFSFLRPLH